MVAGAGADAQSKFSTTAQSRPVLFTNHVCIVIVCSIDIAILHFFTFMLNSTHRHIQQFMLGHVIFGHNVFYILAHS